MPKIHFYKNDDVNPTVRHLLENIQDLCKYTYDMDHMKSIIRKNYDHIRRTFRKINDLDLTNMMLSPNKKRLVFMDPIN